MSAPDIVKIRARIRALLAKTVDAGCTEAEAETAAARARELLREHGLTEDGVLGYEIVELRMPVGARRAITDPLGSAIAVASGCKTWLEIGHGRNRVYYGFEPDTLVAEYLHEVVYGVVERARVVFRGTPEYKRRRTAKTRKGLMDAFIQGLVDALVGKLLNSAPADQAEKTKKIETAFEATGTSLSKAKPSPRANSNSFAGAYSSGRANGAAVGIHMGMGSSEPTRQIGYRGGVE